MICTREWLQQDQARSSSTLSDTLFDTYLQTLIEEEASEAQPGTHRRSATMLRFLLDTLAREQAG
jgi:hypothetical protein